MDPFTAAALNSNSGDAWVAIEFVATLPYRSTPAFEVTIKLAGVAWDGEEPRPLSMSLAGVWLDIAVVASLRDHIVAWNRLPLGLLATEALSKTFELACAPSQSFRIAFGPRQDTISSRNPVASFTWTIGTFRGEFHFVTDQSCLAIFADALAESLAHHATVIDHDS